MTAKAREHTRELAEYIGGKQTAETQRKVRNRENELDAMRKRATNLDTISRRLYGDSVPGRITMEQFQSLSASYTAGQEKLK